MREFMQEFIHVCLNYYFQMTKFLEK